MLTVGSLFSGIGGLDLGLERAGMKVVWQSEIDPYACKVLKKHWPDVPNLGDITKITEAPQVDLICGGFPCQDISNAGKRAGITGSRSGLWGEMVRAVRLVRPLHVLVENVAALLARGMGRVLGDLAESGYDSEWDCLPACAFGAPHCRDRVFAIAYPERGEPWDKPWRGAFERVGRIEQSVAWNEPAERALRRLRGVDDGTAYGVERTDCIRNSVVPQVAEWIGRRILERAGGVR